MLRTHDEQKQGRQFREDETSRDKITGTITSARAERSSFIVGRSERMCVIPPAFISGCLGNEVEWRNGTKILEFLKRIPEL